MLWAQLISSSMSSEIYLPNKFRLVRKLRATTTALNKPT